MRSTAEKNLRGAAIDWGWDQKMGESWVYFLFFATGLALKCRGNHFCIPLAGRSDSSSAGAGGMRTKGVIYSLSSSCYIPEEQTHGAGFLPQPLWASTCNSVIIFFKNLFIQQFSHQTCPQQDLCPKPGGICSLCQPQGAGGALQIPNYPTHRR